MEIIKKNVCLRQKQVRQISPRRWTCLGIEHNLSMLRLQQYYAYYKQKLCLSEASSLMQKDTA